MPRWRPMTKRRRRRQRRKSRLRVRTWRKTCRPAPATGGGRDRFGTLKCRAGYRHFLVRGFAKVRGEWSLMALCYNFSRVLRIIGPDRWRDLLAQRAAKPLHRLLAVLLRAYRRVSRDVAALRPLYAHSSPCRRWASNSAT